MVHRHVLKSLDLLLIKCTCIQSLIGCLEQTIKFYALTPTKTIRDLRLSVELTCIDQNTWSQFK